MAMSIVLAVPFDDDSWPYATYAKIADYLLLMGYDQHWEEGAPEASPARTGSRTPSTSA